MPLTCILTEDNITAEDGCTTHDHEEGEPLHDADPDDPATWTRYRCLYENGEEVETLAYNHDHAERRTRPKISHGWGSDGIGMTLRPPAWSIIDLVEYPDPSEALS